MKEQNKFAIRLSKRIAELGYSHQDVANILQTSRQTITNYCNGKSQPDIETLASLSTLLHISADYLLGLEIDEITLPPKAKENILSINYRCDEITDICHEFLSWYSFPIFLQQIYQYKEIRKSEDCLEKLINENNVELIHEIAKIEKNLPGVFVYGEKAAIQQEQFICKMLHEFLDYGDNKKLAFVNIYGETPIKKVSAPFVINGCDIEE